MLEILDVLAVIFLTLPSIVLLIETFYSYSYLSFKVLSLSLTNITGIVPAGLCLYYTIKKHVDLSFEFIPFYFITFTSGTYHLCDSINYNEKFCSLNPNIYMYLDFINSYFCISTTLLHIVWYGYKESHLNIFILKRISIVLNLILYSLILILMNDTNIPFIYTSSIISFTVVYIIWKNELYIGSLDPINFKKLSIGILFSSFAFIIYLCTIIFELLDKDYWILHSYCWHIPIMLSSFFIIEAFIKNNEV